MGELTPFRSVRYVGRLLRWTIQRAGIQAKPESSGVIGAGALPALLLVALACAAEPEDQTFDWPIACALFPPSTESLAGCARRDEGGEIVLRPGLVPGREDSDRAFAVLIEGELFFALPSGRTAPALVFDNGPDYFVEGLARTVRDGKVGFVNEELEVVVPRRWDFAFPFENGFARVCDGCSIVRETGQEHGTLAGGIWGLIDRTGRIVVPVEHDLESLPALPPTVP